MILKFIQLFIWVAGCSTVPIIYSFHLNLTERTDKKAKVIFWTTIFMWVTYGMIITLLKLNEKGWGAYAMVFILFHLALCYEEKMPYKILIFFLSILSSTIVDLLINTMLRLFFNDVMWVGTEISLRNTILVILATILLTLIIKLLSILIKKLNTKKLMLDKSVLLFFLVPVSQYLLTTSFFSRSSANKILFNKLLNFPMLICGAAVSIIADVLLFKVLIENSTAQKNKLKLAELEYERKLSLNYYENIQKNADQFMKYRHDFNNILGTAYHLIQSDDNDSKRQGLELLDELFEKNKSTAIPWYCKNRIVNAIIYDKMNYARKSGVDFSVDINIPEETTLDLTDICSIFTNLIDNSLNSAKESSCKKAELSAKYDMGMIFVISKNYPDSIPDIKPTDDHFSDGRLSNHGYGLSILNDIAKKYDGSVKIKTDEEAVEILVAVKG